MEKTYLYSWDDRRDIAVPGNHQDTLTFCAEHFVTTAHNAIKSHGKFFVALFGGSTCKVIYETIASLAYRDKIDWEKVYLFWSDERSVPPKDNDSNYHTAMEYGMKILQIPENHIFRMVAEKDIEKNAEEYENLIRKELGGQPFDLIMLGMGEDGHTASLFPETEGLKEEKKWVIANHVHQKETCRMTMTFPCINSAKNIAIYVLGSNKVKMLSKVLLEKDPAAYLPAARVGTKEHKALWIVEKDAATDLIKHLKD